MTRRKQAETAARNVGAARRVEGETEVVPRPTRRGFSAEYKARILKEADRCRGTGEIGALLRREGLYGSHLTKWRGQVEQDGPEGLSRKRGSKADPESGSGLKVAQLERANGRLSEKLRQAEIIIEFQKKMAELWGSLPSLDGNEETD
jgi:transposase